MGPSLEPLQTRNSQNCSNAPTGSAPSAQQILTTFFLVTWWLRSFYFHGQMSCPERLDAWTTKPQLFLNASPVSPCNARCICSCDEVWRPIAKCTLVRECECRHQAIAC